MLAGNEAFRKRAVAIGVDLGTVGRENRCLGCCLFIWLNLFAALAGKGEVLVPPVANLLWEHEESGLRLPGELAEMMAEQVFGEDVPEFVFFPREGAGEAGDGFGLEGDAGE